MIPAQEVADLLVKIADGSVAAEIIYHDSCVVGVSAGGWLLNFFDDAGDLDFVSSARTLDGREGNIDQWWDEIGKEPLDLLTDEQRKVLQDMFLPRQKPMEGWM